MKGLNAKLMDELIKKLSSGKTEEVLQELLSSAAGQPIEEDLILLSARFTSNERHRRLEVVSHEQYQLTSNQIRQALLELIGQLKQGVATDKKETKEQQTLRILFCESNPFPDRNLFSNVEFREISAILSAASSRMVLDSRLALSLRNLTDSIKMEQADIIHFTAYSDESGIYFHDQSDQPVHVPNDTFYSFFKLSEARPLCLFFNTYVTEELAAKLSSEGVFVIGFNQVIDTFGAIEFATGFYMALSFGKGLKDAFKIGRQALETGNYGANSSKLFAFQEGLPFAQN